MSKTIKIPGRIECTETGNVALGANAVLDDVKGKKQDVINHETDSAIAALGSGKQDVLTFDNVPTEGSNNPVKSGGVYTATFTLSQAIEAILLLIPAAASELNKLADKDFVNSSIATDTATFRGTSAPGLSEQQFLAWANTLTHDLNDYVFWNTVDSVGNTQFKRYKWNGEQWMYEYTLNNSSFTADQWAAITSGITQALVAKLSALPTATELQIALNAKQDTLTFDNTPTAGSNNPVKSSGLYTAFATVHGLIDALTGRMTDAEGDIATNTGNIATNTADIALLQDLYEALTQSALVVVTPTDTWPVANPATKTIYRVVDRTNTPPQYYSDYMWNGTAMVQMAKYNNGIDDKPTNGSTNLIESGGVYDEIFTDSVNIINPNTLDANKYIASSGEIVGAADPGIFSVTDFIPIKGKNISIKGKVSTGSSIRCYVVYAADKSTILYVAQNSSYYQYNSGRGDAYIRIGLKTDMLTSDYPTYFANYGNTLLSYVEYSAPKSLKEQYSELNSSLLSEIDNRQKIDNNLISILKSKIDENAASLNLIDSKKADYSKYITSQGDILSGDANFGVSCYIPVNGNNIIANADVSASRGAFNVYDVSYQLIRTIVGTGSGNQTYTYQNGDAYVRISFSEISNAMANYGDTLFTKENFSGIIDFILDQLKVVDNTGTNIINPNLIENDKYIDPSGSVVYASDLNIFAVTDFIPINGKNISIEGKVSTGSSVACYAVYARNKTTVLYVGTNSSYYEYNAERGDYYIRIGLKNTMLTEDYPSYFANYGNNLSSYEEYSGGNYYLSMTDVYNILSDIEQTEYALNFNQVSIISNPKPLYAVWNDKNRNRNYFNKLYVDHLIYGLSKLNYDFGFTIPRIKTYPIIGFYDNIDPSDSTSKNVVQLNETINLVSGKYIHPVTITRKITKASVGENVKPMVLCIGDSVTDGAGANYQQLQGMPKQYWSWVTWLFANDKKDNGGNGFDFVSVGTAPINSIFGITDQFTLDGVTYKSFATAKGGWALDDLNQPNHEGSGVNPFYDPALGRFSFAYYLANFRTMDDNGNRLYFDANQSTTGTAGQGNIGYLADGTIAKDANNNTLYIGYQITDTESMNICKPTHIVINLNHNSAYANYVSVLPGIISDIKTNVPNVYIILMNIDSTGTFAPALYPQVPYNFSRIDTGLHDKNCEIYNYQITLENIENKIYVCSGNLIQPPVEIIRGIFSQQADYIGLNNYEEFGISPTYPFAPVAYHPNNLAHRGWGYQLYSLIKYTLSL